MDKIPVVSVWLYRDNGRPPDKFNTAVTSTISEADQKIIEWAKDQWSTSSVDVYFIITFLDGETFNNCMEVHLEHASQDAPLTGYVEKITRFYAGISQNGLNDKDYWDLMLATDAVVPGVMQTMKEFLERYDLWGVFQFERADD